MIDLLVVIFIIFIIWWFFKLLAIPEHVSSIDKNLEKLLKLLEKSQKSANRNDS